MPWSGWKIKENCHVLVNQFHENFHSKTLSCRGIRSVLGDVIWCFNTSWGLKGLSFKNILLYVMLRERVDFPPSPHSVAEHSVHSLQSPNWQLSLSVWQVFFSWVFVPSFDPPHWAPFLKHVLVLLVSRNKCFFSYLIFWNSIRSRSLIKGGQDFAAELCYA